MPQASLDRLFSPSEIYHENSKLRPSDRELFAWIRYVNTTPDVRQVITSPFTHYPGAPVLALPHHFLPTSKSFEQILTERRSVHRFSGSPIKQSALAKMLALGGGITHTSEADDGTTWHLRAAPSGGGLYPCSLYCAIWRVEGVTPGLYFYDPMQHALEELQQQDLSSLIADATYLREEAQSACACILISATFARSKFKYAERAYRFILLEAGHIAQNLLLVAQAEGLGTLPVGGFIDDPINEALHFDGVEDAVLYLVFVG